jgi:hypothetical protein
MFLSHPAVTDNNRIGDLLSMTAVIHFTGTPKPWNVVLPPNADLADDSDAEAWGLVQGAALGNWAMHKVRCSRLGYAGECAHMRCFLTLGDGQLTGGN